MNTGTNTVHVREAVQHAAESAASHSYYSIKRVKEGEKKRKGRCFQEGRWGAVGTLNGLRLGNTRKTYRFDLVQVSWSLWGCERFLGACKHCDRVVVREFCGNGKFGRKRRERGRENLHMEKKPNLKVDDGDCLLNHDRWYRDIRVEHERRILHRKPKRCRG